MITKNLEDLFFFLQFDLRVSLQAEKLKNIISKKKN